MAQIVGFGNPLLDMCMTIPDDAVLKKYDLKPANAILAEEKHVPIYEEIAASDNVQYIAGGAGQNSIRVAQWMLQKPHATAYCGCIGKDAYGQKLRSAAEGDGVNVQYLETDEHPTGTCAVLVYEKDRSMVANLAAANHYKKDAHFDTPEIQALVSGARIVYITGFFLTVSPETANAAAKMMSDSNKSFAFNLSAPFLVEVPMFKERVDAILKYADFVFGNETEAAAIGKVNGWGTDVDEVAKKLAALPKANDRPRTVVITQGSKDAVVATAAGGVTHYPTPKMPAEEIVDLNGAGDAFVGGFLSQLAQDKDVDVCIRAANYAAQQIIRASGCTFSGKPDFK